MDKEIKKEIMILNDSLYQLGLKVGRHTAELDELEKRFEKLEKNMRKK